MGAVVVHATRDPLVASDSRACTLFHLLVLPRAARSAHDYLTSVALMLATLSEGSHLIARPARTLSPSRNCFGGF
jgi:hypothetical protein